MIFLYLDRYMTTGCQGVNTEFRKEAEITQEAEITRFSTPTLWLLRFPDFFTLLTHLDIGATILLARYALRASFYEPAVLDVKF